jgi:CubicO group peptidase (beta-lactamase class C family)
MVGGVNVAETFEEQNTVQFFEARNSATSLVSDGASLAAFYEFVLNGGLTSTGEQLLSEETLRKYTTREVIGREKSTGQILSVGRGFLTGSLLPSPFGWWRTRGCFGHPGGFSSLGFADYKTGIAAAIVTNANRDNNDFARRFIPLAGGLRKAAL